MLPDVDGRGKSGAVSPGRSYGRERHRGFATEDTEENRKVTEIHV